MRIASGAAAMLVAALAGCASPASIVQVTEKPVIEVAPDAGSRPIQFRKVVVKLNRGHDIGSLQTGLLCMPNAELVYRGGRYTLDGDELTQVFQDELKKANYTVVGDPDALFDDPEAWKAEYLVAGLVRNIQANICYPLAGWGDTLSAKGESSMQVEWQIYSRLDRKVARKFTTEGYGRVAESRPGGDTDLFLDAFAQATRQLLAKAEFHGLVTQTASAAVPARTPARLVRFRPTGPSTRPLAEWVSDIRLGVVTVFAGNGHGSGFFIDAAGHVLTNEHVVRSAQFVKLELATGREILGEVVATDPRRDVAVIRTEEPGIAGLPIRPDQPGVGSDVFAVGAPLDPKLRSTITRGVVSAYRHEDGLALLQSDVSIQPGNSGGPLLDASGNVVGIAVRSIVRGDAGTGLNFFIPIQDALRALGIEAEAQRT